MSARDVRRGLIVAVLHEVERVAAAGGTVDLEVRFAIRAGEIRPDVRFAERRNVRRLRPGRGRDTLADTE